MRRFQGCDFATATRQKQELAAMVFIKWAMDLAKETRKEVVEFQEKVEQSGRWPQQACTTTFFLIPNNVTSERPIALMPTIVRLWEASRAPEVAKQQYKYCEWDARTDATQELREQSGKSCWRWRSAIFRQERKIMELWPWSWTWRRLSSESSATHFNYVKTEHLGSFFSVLSLSRTFNLHACGSRCSQELCCTTVAHLKSHPLTACFTDHSSTCLTHFHHFVPRHLLLHRQHCL